MDDKAQPQPQSDEQRTIIEHLVARRDADGRVVVLGLDAQGRAVYATTLNAPS